MPWILFISAIAMHTILSMRHGEDGSNPEAISSDTSVKHVTLVNANADTVHPETNPGGKTPSEFDRCKFRSYPGHRYYEIGKPIMDQPSFLSDAKYIRGKLPVVLGSTSSPKKVCVDTHDWEDVQPGRYPFSDGQNPSVVSMSTDQEGGRLSSDVIRPLANIYGAEKLQDMYLGVSVFGNALCNWRMTPEDLASWSYSDLEEAPEKRTVVTVLDEDMNNLGQATILLEHDASWGTNRRKGDAIPAKTGEGYERTVQSLDDPRFFFHSGQLYMLYRHGGRFGYENQVQNPVHFEQNGANAFVAFIRASETFVVCCGRNIALISDSQGGELKALTWVDPVTVIDVEADNLETPQRRLAGKEKSHIHGTNGYMVPLPSTSELLGIAHFHRPENRQKSLYALHGHHYTHALFTIARNAVGEYKLKRLSNEFVFRSMSPAFLAVNPVVVDAETIQFSSGLDVVGSDVDGRLLLSYGVNDCEGIATFLDMAAVHDLLLDADGMEVVDLMAPPE